MRTRTKAVAGIVAVAVALALTAAPAGAGTSDDETGFVSRINALRASQGLEPLRVDAELTAIARRWAASMAEAGKISHNPDFSAQVTQNWRKLGENVGVGPDVDGLHDAFVRSEGHYANLVDPAFTHVGVGVVRGADGILWTSHQFMALFPSEQASPAAAPAPAPEEAPAPQPAATTPAAGAPAARATAPARAARGSGATDTAAERAPAAAPAPPAALTHALAGLRLLDAAA